MVILLTPSPVGKQRSQDHQGVLHQRDNFRGGVTTQEKFTAVLEGAELEGQAAPVGNDLLQLGFDVLLLHRADADILFNRGKKGVRAQDLLGFSLSENSGCFPMGTRTRYQQRANRKKGPNTKGFKQPL